MEKILELARKLRALADKGVDGEKDTALLMLQRLMKKHGITIDMISEDEIKEHSFKIEETYSRFFGQIVASVLGSKVSVSYYPHQKGKKREQFINCTPYQAIEIEAKYNFFVECYKKELELFYQAFIQQNHLYVKKNDNDEDDSEEKELSREEREKLYKMVNMMQGMDRHIFTKQLSR